MRSVAFSRISLADARVSVASPPVARYRSVSESQWNVEELRGFPVGRNAVVPSMSFSIMSSNLFVLVKLYRRCSITSSRTGCI